MDTRSGRRHAPIRTYKARRGRVTPGQADALTRLRDVFAVPVDGDALDLAQLFGRTAPVTLDVGFGMGEATAALAQDEPDRDVLAVDVHTPGIGALLRDVERLGLRNVRIADGDAVVLLRDMLAPGSLDEVRVLFPDPWPKVRHHKRRLVQPAFAALVASRLRPGGRLHVATDWDSYAEQVLDVFAAEPLLDGAVAPRPPRPVTRFERRAMDAGRRVTDVVAVRR